LNTSRPRVIFSLCSGGTGAAVTAWPDKVATINPMKIGVHRKTMLAGLMLSHVVVVYRIDGDG
jgi:hypothetical protein